MYSYSTHILLLDRQVLASRLSRASPDQGLELDEVGAAEAGDLRKIRSQCELLGDLQRARGRRALRWPHSQGPIQGLP